MSALISNFVDKVGSLRSRVIGDGKQLTMQAPGPAVLLMEDKEGEEATSYVGMVHRTVIHKVLKGSLLTPIPAEKQIPRSDGRDVHNYQTMYKEHTITLFCGGEDVSPLSDYDHLLLAGIQSPAARYQTFIAPNKLDWGARFKVGDYVLVSITGPYAAESGATQKASAVIRYVGPVEGLPGLTFGVEILDPHYYGQGSTDGTFRDVRYFTCRDGNGLFVSFNKLSEDPAGGSLTEPPPGGQRYTPQDGQQNGRKKPKTPPVAKPSVGPPSRFKEGDRVVIFNKDGIAIHGTVRWTGPYGYQDEKKKYHTIAAVGIETDVKIFRTELESSLSPKSHAFTVGKGKGQVFVHEQEAMLETDYLPKIPAEKPPAQTQQPKLHHEQQERGAHAGKPPEQPPPNPPSDVLDVNELVQQAGVGHTQFMQEQSELLKQAAERRKGKELAEVRQAIGPDESLHMNEQERLLRQYSEERRREVEMDEKKRKEAGKGGTNHPYETVATPPSHRRRASQGAQPYPQDSNQGYPSASRPSDLSTSAPPLPPRPHHDPPAQPGPHVPQHVAYAGQPGAPPPAGLGVGSAVQLVQDPSRTGVIRWTGYIPVVQGLIAGVELDEPMEGCGDGEWQGQRYFSCLPGRGFFCPAANLRPDARVVSSYFRAQGSGHPGNPLLQFPEWEEQDQNMADDQITKYLGEERGIQGHQNSCYLDATIFGLFALSDVFDSLFLESGLKSTPGQIQRDISEMLWRGIVNPLRKNGAVRFESVMRLRNKLDELGKMEGVSTAEKDPEEFLNMLFKHTLHVDPFIQIKRPFGTEPEFFVQLFVEFDESLKTPTVEKLLQKMFKEQQISFAHVPSKLLVQVPRYGKQFKTYKRIIPGLKLDPAPLMDCPYGCYICGQPAWNACAECKGSFPKGDNGTVYLCDACSERVHSHKDRAHHRPERCGEIAEAGELELLSVICIETSHYVCFTRDSEGKWVFSDSMANRLYDTYNIPRGVDCTAELNEWVYCGNTERLMAAGPRELPELVRRFTQDVYMCVYIQPDYGMYG